MDMLNISEDAKFAVKQGIYWLDEHHPNWATRIDLDRLMMSSCASCVIGQAVGDYSKTTGDAVSSYPGSQEAVIWAVEHGFESPTVAHYTMAGGKPTYTFMDLETLWTKEVLERLG